eukprot:1188574-Prorocentrum_minimum.AAC.2
MYVLVQVLSFHSLATGYPGSLPPLQGARLWEPQDHQNIPARLASDWSVVRIYPRVSRLIGPP